MFSVRDMDCKNDHEYWLETTYQGFSITYCQQGKIPEEEARKAFEEFYKKEKKSMNSENSDYSIFIIESENKDYAGILWMQKRVDCAMYKEPIAWICNIFIEPKYRKRGLASELLDFAETWTRNLGMKIIALHVATSNTNARRLYEKNCYELVEEKGGSCYYQKYIDMRDR